MLKRNKIWEEEEGYFTLEASFLVTFVFLLLFAVILSGLYICDLNQAKSFLNQRVTELSSDKEPYDSNALSEDKKQIESQLFVTGLTEFDIGKTDKQVEGSIGLSMRISLPMIGKWFGQLWTDRFCLCVDVGNATERLRRWNQIE